MLSSIGLGARKLSGANFSFTSPKGSPKAPAAEANTSTDASTNAKDSAMTDASAAPGKESNGKKRRERKRGNKSTQAQESAEKEAAQEAVTGTEDVDMADVSTPQSKKKRKRSRKDLEASENAGNLTGTSEKENAPPAEEDATMTEAIADAKTNTQNKKPKTRRHNYAKKTQEKAEAEANKMEEDSGPSDKPANLEETRYQEGDWKCGGPDCNFYNFGKNIKCLRCKAPKDKGTPAEPDDAPYVKEKFTLNRPVVQKKGPLEDRITIPLEKRITKEAKSRSRKERQKENKKLPKNAKIMPRPLLHPPIPSPFSSTQHVIYISRKSPFVPQIKRIRSLLTEGQKRQKQSLSATKKGALDPKEVEQAIADASKEDSAPKEVVLVKAAGNAIPKALEIAMWYQGQSDCVVKIDSGMEKAIDDITLLKEDKEVLGEGAMELDEAEKAKQGDAAEEPETVDFDEVEGGAAMEVDDGEAANKQKEQDVPETRVKDVSTVTIAISLK